MHTLHDAVAPAFLGGMPGGVELLVILLVAVVLFGIPVLLLLGGGGYLLARGATEDERIAELESEVEALRDQLSESDRDPAERDGTGRGDDTDENDGDGER
ncbi:hypothetical protein GCM10009037_14550 [Halarchaeum grantii]|uniref:Sec-independent protein translocase protein TatA n=1 Tax=Halarchaeum grantii TaxID=1193105 RepID=A0A830EUP0_9EURY|nr:preprotein translocase subunit TatA [Halarchaeum grantii]GGL32009.1 hypothetical protein GCM10009037_14550 [Halarchaeum grantii]